MAGGHAYSVPACRSIQKRLGNTSSAFEKGGILRQKVCGSIVVSIVCILAIHSDLSGAFKHLTDFEIILIIASATAALR